MLSQLTTPEGVGTWLLIGFLVVNALGGLGGLVAIFATRREVDAIDRRVMAAESRIGKESGDLHEKINKVAIAVGGLEASTDSQNQKLSHMDAKLDRLIERRA
jgi:hypothetical protein